MLGSLCGLLEREISHSLPVHFMHHHIKQLEFYLHPVFCKNDLALIEPPYDALALIILPIVRFMRYVKRSFFLHWRSARHGQ